MSTYQVEGIVLRRLPLGEADQIVTLFTRGEGKLRAVARGVRRARSRLASAVQPFTYGRYEVWQGRSLDGIRQAAVLNGFPRLRQRLESLTGAAYMAELTEQLTVEGHADARHFVLLLRSLATLEEGSDPALLVAFFQLRSLDVAGVRPSLGACLSCGAAAPGSGPVQLAPVAGGYLCPDCRGDGGGPSVRFGSAAWSLLRRLVAVPAEEAVRLTPEPGQAPRLLAALDTYIAHQLGRPLKSGSFLDILSGDEGG